jgi:hypothetical protein
MLAVILAVITLSNSDPDPVKANPVSLTAPAAGTGLLGLDQPLSSEAANANTSLTVCTYGAPQLGPQLFNDASALSRTFTQPQCDGSSAFGPASMFAAGMFGGFRFLEPAMPWTRVNAQAPVLLQTGTRTASIPGHSLPALSVGDVSRRTDGFEFHGPAANGRFRDVRDVRDELRPASPARTIAAPDHH